MDPITPTEDRIAALERRAYSRQGTTDDLRILADLHRTRDDERRRGARPAPDASRVRPPVDGADLPSPQEELVTASTVSRDDGEADPAGFDSTVPTGSRRGRTLAAAGIGLGAVLTAFSATTWAGPGERSDTAPVSEAGAPSVALVDAFAREAGPQDVPPPEVAVMVDALSADAEVRWLGEADGVAEYAIRWADGTQIQEMRISVEVTPVAAACNC